MGKNNRERGLNAESGYTIVWNKSSWVFVVHNPSIDTIPNIFGGFLTFAQTYSLNRKHFEEWQS